MKEDSWEEIFLRGDLEEAKKIITENYSNIDIKTALGWVIKMKSRNYKLYKQIVLSKMLLMYCPRSPLRHKDMSEILQLAINKNSTFIAKLLLREGVTVSITPDMKISDNMRKLLFSFGYSDQKTKV